MAKSRPLKKFIRRLGGYRAGCEKGFRVSCPNWIIPIISCLCIELKAALLSFVIEQLLVVVACITGVISCFMRMLSCPHGKDLFYSCMEMFLLTEEAIGLYWDAKWWRKYEQKKDDDKESEEKKKPEDLDV